jgi:hypothetical protein
MCRCCLPTCPGLCRRGTVLPAGLAGVALAAAASALARAALHRMASGRLDPRDRAAGEAARRLAGETARL